MPGALLQSRRQGAKPTMTFSISQQMKVLQPVNNLKRLIQRLSQSLTWQIPRWRAWFKTCIFHLPCSFLLTHNPEGSRQWLKCFGLCPPPHMGDLDRVLGCWPSSVLIVTGWWEVSQEMEDLCLSSHAIQIKVKIKMPRESKPALRDTGNEITAQGKALSQTMCPSIRPNDSISGYSTCHENREEPWNRDHPAGQGLNQRMKLGTRS